MSISICWMSSHLYFYSLAKTIRGLLDHGHQAVPIGRGLFR